MYAHQSRDQNSQIELTDDRLQKGERAGRSGYGRDVPITQRGLGDKAVIRETENIPGVAVPELKRPRLYTLQDGKNGTPHQPKKKIHANCAHDEVSGDLPFPKDVREDNDHRVAEKKNHEAIFHQDEGRAFQEVSRPEQHKGRDGNEQGDDEVILLLADRVYSRKQDE